MLGVPSLVACSCNGIQQLLVINQLTDQAHEDAAKAFCQQLDDQAEGCVSPPVGYLDPKKERAALLGQPLPLPEPRS